MLGFKKFRKFNSIEYMRRDLGEPCIDLSHLTDSQIREMFMQEHAGFWGHWGLAKKYSDDTPGQNWKRISKLMKKYKAER